MTHPLLALTLALAVTTPPLEATRHSEQGVAHYDAGRLDAAIDEFAAAYAALPDPRTDRAGREEMLGSLHGLLLEAHAASRAAAPLCRLQMLLREHLAALRTAQGEEPAWPEVAINQGRLDRVSEQLASLPGATCEPATEDAAAAMSASSVSAEPAHVADATVTPAPTPVPPLLSTTEARDRSRRGLRIAGGVVLGVSAGLVGVMAFGIAREQRLSRDADAVDRGVIGGQISPEQYARLLDDRAGARTHLGLAIGTGVAAFVGATVGVTLLALARRPASRRVALAPWWLHSGAGLTVALPLP